MCACACESESTCYAFLSLSLSLSVCVCVCVCVSMCAHVQVHACVCACGGAMPCMVTAYHSGWWAGGYRGMSVCVCLGEGVWRCHPCLPSSPLPPPHTLTRPIQYVCASMSPSLVDVDGYTCPLLCPTNCQRTLDPTVTCRRPITSRFPFSFAK